MTDSTISFIETHEEEDAKEFVRKHLGFDPPRPTGYHLAIMIYTRPEEVKKIVNDQGEEVTLYAPDSVRTEDRYRSMTALVVAMGPEAYVHKERFKESGPWCKVGDWVIIPRNEGTQIIYKEVPMQLIPDDRILCVIDDPAVVRRD